MRSFRERRYRAEARKWWLHVATQEDKNAALSTLHPSEVRRVELAAVLAPVVGHSPLAAWVVEMRRRVEAAS